jgi:hypothetical protein
MGARTRWFATVGVVELKTIEIYAVTSSEAEQEASNIPGVVYVKEVKHWTEVERDLGLSECQK